MNEDAQFIMDSMNEQMASAISHLETGLVKIRAGKAASAMLDGVYVDYYGSRTPLAQVANVSTPDSRTLSIQPWEKGMLDPITKAIQAANLGFNPSNNGTVIIINVPPLTEDRRKDLVKRTKIEGEHAKVSIRTARKDANEEVKKITKLPEDERKSIEVKIQEATDGYIAKVDKLLEQKDKEIMTV